MQDTDDLQRKSVLFRSTASNVLLSAFASDNYCVGPQVCPGPETVDLESGLPSGILPHVEYAESTLQLGEQTLTTVVQALYAA